MKQKALTLALIILTSTALVLAPLSLVLGQSVTGFAIIQITKQGEFTSISSANVGDAITVAATLNVMDSPYKMWFGDVLVGEGTSEGYYIASNFSIPEIPGGTYEITLQDVTWEENTTQAFGVETKYLVKPIVPEYPRILQEGSSVVLNVSVTGGSASTDYVANITVVFPVALPDSPWNFSRLVTFTSSARGTASELVTYPDSNFQPSGSTTIYAGTYQTLFNSSDLQTLATDSFIVGFTNALDYHRGETVTVRAVGYQPSQSASLSIRRENSSIFSQQLTADVNGVITSSWLVPTDAALGQYNITVAPSGANKTIPDTQIINLPGFTVDFTALNLAGDSVPELVIEALDRATSQLYNGTTGENGIASIKLETGGYTVGAYWNGVRVGQIELSISGNVSSTIQCQLTNLKIIVKDRNGILIPLVNLNVTFEYVTTATGTHKSGSAQVQTGALGSISLDSALPNIAYVIDASKYGVIFNSGNNTINLPAQPNYAAVIVCPDKGLTIRTVDHNAVALPAARLVLFETGSGIFYTAMTDNAGSVSFRVTFGQYKVSVYSANNVLLNETVLNVLSDTDSQIRCIIYNIDVSVSVVDFFGNPVPNVSVELSRAGTDKLTDTTSGDGKVEFPNIIGGNVEIIAYPSGNRDSYVAANVDLGEQNKATIQMSKYVSLGGFLIETSLLATLLIIMLVVLMFVIIEVLLRRRRVQAKE